MRTGGGGGLAVEVSEGSMHTGQARYQERQPTSSTPQHTEYMEGGHSSQLPIERV